MRVAHVSDTHLGYAEYDARDAATGLNVRELDAYRAFERACSAIRQSKPDLVLHSGDLFDHPQPPNIAIVTAFLELGRLARDGIPVVVAAGNHSIPANRGTACVLKALEAIPGVVAAVDAPRTVRLGTVCVSAVPHMRSERELAKAVEDLRPDPSARNNVLVLHAGLRGGPPREWTEARVPRTLLREKARLFDYIALGHYHRPMKVAPMAWYAGATERFHGDRSRGRKGFLIADLDERRVEFHPVPNRPRFEVGPLDVAGLEVPALLRRVAEASSGIEPGAVVRLTLSGLSPAVYEKLDPAELRSALGPVLHAEIRLHRRGGRRPRPQAWKAASLLERFKAYASARLGDPELLESVLEAARPYFERSREADDP